MFETTARRGGSIGRRLPRPIEPTRLRPVMGPGNNNNNNNNRSSGSWGSCWAGPAPRRNS